MYEQYHKSSSQLSEKLQSLKQLIKSSGASNSNGRIKMSEKFDDALYSNGNDGKNLYRTSSPVQDDENQNEYFDDIVEGDVDGHYVEDEMSLKPKMGAEKQSNTTNTGLHKNITPSRAEYVRRDMNLDMLRASPHSTPSPQYGSNNMMRYASEEIKMLKEHSHFLYSKVVSLENKVQESQARIRLQEEENQTIRDICDRTKRNNEDLQRQLTQKENQEREEKLRATQEKERLNAKIELAEQRLNSSREIQQNLETIRSELEESNRQKMDQITSFKLKNSDMENKIEGLSHEIDILRDDRKSEEQRHKAEMDNLLKRIHDLENVMKQQKEAAEERRTALEKELDNEKESHKKSISQTKQEMDQFHNDIDMIQQQFTALQGQKLQIEQEKILLEQKVNFLESKLDTVQDVMDQQKSHNVELQRSAQEMQRDRDNAWNLQKEAEDKLDNFKKDAEKETASLHKDVDRLEFRVNDLSHQLEQSKQETVKEVERCREMERNHRYELEMLEKDRQSAQSEFQRLSEVHQRSQKDKQEVVGKLQQRTQELEEENSRIHQALQLQEQNFYSSNEGIKVELHAVESLNLELKNKSDQMLKELLIMQDKCKTLKEENRLLNEKNHTFEAHMSQFKRAVERAKSDAEQDLQLDIQTLQEQIKALKAQNKTLKASREDAARQLELQKEDKRALEKQNNILTASRQQSDQAVSQMVADMETLRTSMANANDQADIYLKQIQDLKRERDELRAKIFTSGETNGPHQRKSPSISRQASRPLSNYTDRTFVNPPQHQPPQPPLHSSPVQEETSNNNDPHNHISPRNTRRIIRSPLGRVLEENTGERAASGFDRLMNTRERLFPNRRR